MIGVGLNGVSFYGRFVRKAALRKPPRVSRSEGSKCLSLTTRTASQDHISERSRAASLRSARPLRAGFPFLYGRLVGIEVAREDWLANVILLAQRLDLAWGQLLPDGQAGLIEGPHRLLVDAACSIHTFDAGVDRFEGIALEHALSHHCKSPIGRRPRFRYRALRDRLVAGGETFGTCRGDLDVQIRSHRLLGVQLVNLGRSNR